MIRRLAVFTGAREGSEPWLAEAAYDVGRQLAERGIELVYGGGGAGLMGAVSQGVLDHGGQSLGIQHKPVGFLNLRGFWDPLVEMLHRLVEAGLMDQRTVDELVVADDLGSALEQFGD